MMGYVFGFLTATLLIGVIWKFSIIRRKDHLKHISEVVLRVAAGNLRTRVHTYPRITDQELVKNINSMLNTIEERLNRMLEERNVLHHILEGMNTGVVYVVSSGRIQIMNRMAQKMFRYTSDQYFEKKHWEVFRHYGLNAAIDRALLFGTPRRQEIQFREDLIVDFRVICLEGDGSPARLHHAVYNVLVLCDNITQWHRLEKIRSDFIANVSHELKTPITAIQGFAETLSSEVADEQTRSAFLQVIYEEAVRMRHLVEDLLTLSKLETQDIALNFRTVDLFTVVKRAFDPLQEEAHKRNLDLKMESPSEITVWGDEDKLVQVVLNLIMNAISYTPPGGSIFVSWDAFVDRVKVHVRDTGIGIPEEHQKRIFERFYRVNQDRSRASGGTGLGLAIVKHIVSAHGGQVGLNSRVDEGSDFWFTLPRYEGVSTNPHAIV